MSALKLYHTEPGALEVGVDEVGRGSLIGDVYAGAVFWDPNVTSPLIMDSKKLNERKRLQAYDFIRENALAFGIGQATAQEIDDLNILNASLLAMRRAIDICQILPELILVDGTQFKVYENRREDAVPHTTVINGDAFYYSIAAASIIAKVSRDQAVVQLVEDHPELGVYQLAQNKGYGSVNHIKAIRNWGISPWHRRSFGICKTAPLAKTFNQGEQGN